MAKGVAAIALKNEVCGRHKKWVDDRLSQGNKYTLNVHRPNGSFHTMGSVDAVHLRSRLTTPLFMVYLIG